MRVVADSHAIVWYVKGSSRLSDRADAALSMAEASDGIGRDALGDPWDRFILATAVALELPLVTRDGRIQKTKLVETVW